MTTPEEGFLADKYRVENFDWDAEEKQALIEMNKGLLAQLRAQAYANCRVESTMRDAHVLLLERYLLGYEAEYGTGCAKETGVVIEECVAGVIAGIKTAQNLITGTLVIL